jgi:hypothetical protein
MYNYVLKDSAYIGKSGATTLCFIQEEKRIDFKGDWVMTAHLPSRKSIWRLQKRQYQLGKGNLYRTG